MFEAAYDEQQRLVSRLVSAGEVVRGWKIGATSGAVRARLGTSEPFFAVLFESHLVADGTSISTSGCTTVMVECELAFELERDLAGPGATAHAVRERLGRVHAAFDVIGLTGGGPRGAADVIRTNGSTLAVVLGKPVQGGCVPDPADVGVSLCKEGRVVLRGQGKDVMGDPCAAVAWLANRLATRGVRISAGHLILGGSMTPPLQVQPGDELEAEFGTLGHLRSRFE